MKCMDCCAALPRTRCSYGKGQEPCPKECAPKGSGELAVQLVIAYGWLVYHEKDAM